jgi:hypothetical protein
MKMKNVKRMKFAPVKFGDGETEQLVALVEEGWEWIWPGWEEIAESLNKKYSNDRTAVECQEKYDSVIATR